MRLFVVTLSTVWDVVLWLMLEIYPRSLIEFIKANFYAPKAGMQTKRLALTNNMAQLASELFM